MKANKNERSWWKSLKIVLKLDSKWVKNDKKIDQLSWNYVENPVKFDKKSEKKNHSKFGKN